MFKHISENKILAAIEAGEFDNLPGKGKPLRLEDNPYEPPEQRTANRLLKSNGFTLPWIQDGKDIEQDRSAARRRLRYLREQSILENRPAVWEMARAAFAAQVSEINRRILSYNLTVPSARFQKPFIDFETELALALAAETV